MARGMYGKITNYFQFEIRILHATPSILTVSAGQKLGIFIDLCSSERQSNKRIFSCYYFLKGVNAGCISGCYIPSAHGVVLYKGL